MGFIGKRSELRTGYQEIENWRPKLDLQCDFVMAYGINVTLEERIDCFREKGYEVHLMTGCAWGEYEDYLTGSWDGKEHWEESQLDRKGKRIEHGINTPYMVPTLSFTDYLIEKICKLVDKGISAIHMEEPEFWDAGGYSKAFQKEYEDFYKTPFEEPDSSLDARYRCSALKAYLYTRLVGKLSKAVKEYSRKTYQREISFYVATHSLINYTQWKIMSPESKLLDMEDVDGFIAQIWSGTSGTGNVYEGHYQARTFETAYLEYGIMQEMVKNTDKAMWFLHDPVEDFPEHTWKDYRNKYLKTLTASLFWPHVNKYEVCPWPNRVFEGRYPRKAGMAAGMIPTDDMEGAKDIPKEYSTLLSGMIQTLANMEQKEYEFLGNKIPVGIVMADTGLFQRTFPKFHEDAPYEADMFDGEDMVTNTITSFHNREEEAEFYRKVQKDKSLFLKYVACCAYPNFFGLSMPLLKYGLPLQPVYLENTGRYEDYLSEYKYLILSYEHMKPETILYNEAIIKWVEEGGCLIYVGDGSDPYHAVKGWWNTKGNNYKNPVEHLWQHFSLEKEPENGIYSVKKGSVAVYNEAPAILTTSEDYAHEYRKFVKEVLAHTGYEWKDTNHLVMRRGPYVISAVLSESCSKEPYVAEGTYTDLLSYGYPIVHRVEVQPEEEGLLFDYSKIEEEELCIIATAARIEKLLCENDSFVIEAKAADQIHVFMRLRMPFELGTVAASAEDGSVVPVEFSWEKETRTLLISYDSKDMTVTITGHK